MEPIGPMILVGYQVHDLAKYVTHPSEYRRIFDLNWSSKHVNGMFLQCFHQVMPGNTRPSTFIVAVFIILGT